MVPASRKEARGQVHKVSLKEAERLNPLDYAMASRDEDVMTMVRQALDAQNCILAFQPIVHAAAPDKVAFYEGLIRVRDDAGRIIPAHHFMNDIEETDIGREIDAASLLLGLQILRRQPELRLSINVSARSLGDGKWRRILNQHLMKDESVGERLILEFTESSAMMLHEVVQRFMSELQPRGVAFALDDFGAGGTSFRHLQDFFFDIVKIDRTFINGIADRVDNQVVTAALLAVARQFEMVTVAAGVESAEDAAMLRHLGVDCLQGFYTGAPRLRI